MTSSYQVGEKVLAYQGILIYDAKILDIALGRSEPYFLHYQRWSKNWDEWVKAEHLLKDTAENREKQMLAKQQMNMPKASNAKKRAAKSNSTNASTKRRRRNQENLPPDSNESENVVKNEAVGECVEEMPLPLPMALKKQLVHDWEMVTQQPMQLVPLPRAPCINQIIINYVNSIYLSPKETFRVVTLFEGFEHYFNQVVGLILLYDNEQAQFENLKVTHPDVRFSEIYGAEHLLRLFVRLPTLLAQATLTDDDRKKTQSHLVDFTQFLRKHHSNYFLSDYGTAEPASEPAV